MVKKLNIRKRRGQRDIPQADLRLRLFWPAVGAIARNLPENVVARVP